MAVRTYDKKEITEKIDEWIKENDTIYINVNKHEDSIKELKNKFK